MVVYDALIIGIRHYEATSTDSKEIGLFGYLEYYWEI
jgi:hypothetical protein